MLRSQQQFTEYMHKLEILTEKTTFSWDRDLSFQISNTELLIPVIGAFSAGKSSLLNTFIGENWLPVGIAPETELATELHFSEKPYLLAIRHDGTEQMLPVEDLALVNKESADYSHLRLYINSPALAAISPLVLVDMPGYGSSLENHNKALAYYLPRGSHFIVVTSVEDGTITQSMLRQLDDIKSFESDFSFILSKTNLRDSGQVKQVSDYINEQLQLYFGSDKHILGVDNQSAENFRKVLSTIDPEQLFHKIFIDRLKDQNIDLINQINFSQNVIKNNKQDNENASFTLKKSLDEILIEREKTQQEMKYRFSTPLVNRIANAIDSDLNDRVDYLAKLSLSKNASGNLEREISDIIRGNLTSKLKHEMEHVSTELIEQFSNSLTKNNSMLASLDKNWINAIAEQTETKLKTFSNSIGTLSERMPAKNDAGRVYRLISTTLAITTSVLNPVLEIIIVFLPDIIRWFSSFNAEEKARSNLLNDVFPGIKSQLRHHLPDIVDEQLTILLNSIATEFEERIQQQQILITNYQHQREQEEASVEKQLETLQALSQDLKTLATSYLYH